MCSGLGDDDDVMHFVFRVDNSRLAGLGSGWREEWLIQKDDDVSRYV